MNGYWKAGFAVLVTIGAAVTVKRWTDRHIYNQDGYNALGYNRSGYNRSGYNEEGYNRQGFNKAGFDRDGYDTEGYDVEGYNRMRRDRNGRDRNGYDINGFNAKGYDKNGYNTLGYNQNGVDRCSHSMDYYRRRVSEMENNQRTAYEQLEANNFRYSLSDIRVGIENGIKDILAHKIGAGYENNKLGYNLDICEKKKIMDQELIIRLDSAKKHCNRLLHENGEATSGQVYFCYKVLCEVTDELKSVAGLSA